MWKGQAELKAHVGGLRSVPRTNSKEAATEDRDGKKERTQGRMVEEQGVENLKSPFRCVCPTAVLKQTFN